MDPQVRIFDSVFDLAQAAATQFYQRVAEVVAQHRTFSVALSGGSTPQYLYAALVEQAQRESSLAQLWEHAEVFFGDERYVEPTDPQSNFFNARAQLFEHLPLAPKAIYPIPTHFAASRDAASAYSRLLQAHVRQISGVPNLDLVFLGMGEDGHCASLFPESPFVEQLVHDPGRDTSLVHAEYVPKVAMDRVTLTPLIINNAAAVWFLVSGASKAAVLQKVLFGPKHPEELPSQLIQPKSGELVWWVSQDAGCALGK